MTKHPREVEGIGVAKRLADASDGGTRGVQKVGGVAQAEIAQESRRSGPSESAKESTEMLVSHASCDGGGGHTVQPTISILDDLTTTTIGCPRADRFARRAARAALDSVQQAAGQQRARGSVTTTVGIDEDGRHPQRFIEGTDLDDLPRGKARLA